MDEDLPEIEEDLVIITSNNVTAVRNFTPGLRYFVTRYHLREDENTHISIARHRPASQICA